jgi:hypothetical protein
VAPVPPNSPHPDSSLASDCRWMSTMSVRNNVASGTAWGVSRQVRTPGAAALPRYRDPVPSRATPAAAPARRAAAQPTRPRPFAGRDDEPHRKEGQRLRRITGRRRGPGRTLPAHFVPRSAYVFDASVRPIDRSRLPRNVGSTSILDSRSLQSLYIAIVVGLNLGMNYLRVRQPGPFGVFCGLFLAVRDRRESTRLLYLVAALRGPTDRSRRSLAVESEIVVGPVRDVHAERGRERSIGSGHRGSRIVWAPQSKMASRSPYRIQRTALDDRWPPRVAGALAFSLQDTLFRVGVGDLVRELGARHRARA